MSVDNWWEHLDVAQIRLYGGYIDSRVRLLGEPYGRATESVRADSRIRTEVLAVRARPNPDCASHDRPHGPHELMSPGGNKPGARCDGVPDNEATA